MITSLDSMLTTSWRSLLGLRRFLNAVSMPAQIMLVGVILAIYTLGVFYQPAIASKRMFMPDDRVHVEFVKEHGPFDAFYQPLSKDDLYYSAHYFRPTFITQTWFLYQLFQFNIHKFLAASFAFHVFSALLLFLTFRAISKDFMIALILALIYVGHFYVRALLYYVTDSAAFTIMLQAIVIWLIVYFRDHSLWYVALAAALIALPLTRENGLAVNAGVIIYHVYAAYKQHLTRRQSGIVIAITLVAVAVYFVLRSRVMPEGARFFIDNGGFFFQALTVEQVEAMTPAQTIGLVIYYWVSSLLSLVLPIFRDQGTITIGDAIVTLSILAAGIFVTYVAAQRERWSASRRMAALAAAILIGLIIPLTLTSLIEFDPLTSSLAQRGEGLIFGFHALAAMLTIYALASQWSTLSVPHRGLVLMMIVIALLSASLGLVYFRFRHLRYGLAALLTCIAIVYANLPTSPTRQVVRTSIGISSTLLAATTLIAALPY